MDIVPDSIPTIAARIAPLSAGAAAALRRQRLRGADLRDRLVSAAPAGHRLVGGLAGRAARHVHGRHVPRQPLPAALHFRAASPAAGLCVSRAWHWRCSAAGAVWDAARRRRLHGVGRPRHHRHPAARRFLPAICLLPPTLLMGATLPAIARWVETTPQGVVVARASSTAATSRARCSAVCSPASTCCACYDMRRTRPMSPSRSNVAVALRSALIASRGDAVQPPRGVERDGSAAGRPARGRSMSRSRCRA